MLDDTESKDARTKQLVVGVLFTRNVAYLFYTVLDFPVISYYITCWMLHIYSVLCWSKGQDAVLTMEAMSYHKDSIIFETLYQTPLNIIFLLNLSK